MGERHDAEHSVAQARQRVSAIAEELSRRASGEYVRERAMEAAGDFKERAKMRARQKTYQVRDQALDHPWVLGLIGGAVGAIVGKVLGDRARARYRHDDFETRPSAPHYGYGSSLYDEYDETLDRPYDEYTATHGTSESLLITDDASLGGGGVHQAVRGADFGAEQPESGGLKEKAADAVGALKDRAENVKHRAANAGAGAMGRARGMASRAKERLPDRDQLRHGAQSVRHSTEDRPELWALGALVAGALFGSMVPITDKERRALGPAKARAQVGLDTLKSEAIGKVDELKDNARAMASGMMSELKNGEASATNAQGPNWQQPQPTLKASDDASAGGGLIGGYGADTGADQTTGIGYGEESPGGGRTFHAGGSEDENRGSPGWSAGSDPDVTKH